MGFLYILYKYLCICLNNLMIWVIIVLGDEMNYKDNYNFWKKQNLVPELQKELEQLNQTQIEDAFYQNLNFGTGGLRGIMGVGTNRVNIYVISKATLGLANYLNEKGLTRGVAISYDNRKDSKVFAKHAAMVLAKEGIPSYLFDELRPTPMLSFAVRHFNCDAGIMITASHNPKEYNGYKVYNKTGAQVNLEEANLIINHINQIENPFEIETLDDMITPIDQSFDDIYLNKVRGIKIYDEEKKVKIVYSPLHGTGGPVIPKFLKAEGFDIYPYEPQMVNDPNFGATKSSNPEEALAYEGAISYAKEIDADIVMLTDPDADRLGIAVKHHDTYQLVSGNQTASIELFYLLNEKQKNNNLPSDGQVYTTNVTTDLIKDIGESFGLKVITTLTGFKFIGEQADIYEGKKPYVFGCEESYGSLISDFVRDKDAVQAVYMLSEIANHLKLQGLTIIDYLDIIYSKYGTYYEYTNPMKFGGIEGADKIKRIMAYYRENPPVLPDQELIAYDDVLLGFHVENGEKTPLTLPKSNVLKYYYSDHTWVVFRPSGTEPKIKVYFGVKFPSKEKAEAYVEVANKVIVDQIEKI